MAGKGDILALKAEEKAKLRAAASAAKSVVQAWVAELQDDRSALAKMVDAEIGRYHNQPPRYIFEEDGSLPVFARDDYSIDDLVPTLENYLSGKREGNGANKGKTAPDLEVLLGRIQGFSDAVRETFTHGYDPQTRGRVWLTETVTAFDTMIASAKEAARHAMGENKAERIAR